MHIQKCLFPVAACSILSLMVPAGLRLMNEGGEATRSAASAGQALALYAQATDLVQAGRDTDAAHLLRDARYQPLTITSRSGPAPAPDDIASSGLMIRLGSALCKQAAIQAQAGHSEAARGWIRHARTAAAHVLETQLATLDALQTARAIDEKVGRTELAMEKQRGRVEQAQRIARRESALRAFYESEILPEIALARDQRTASLHHLLLRTVEGGEREQAIREMDRRLDQSDSELAARLLQRYAAERSRQLA